MKYLSIVAKLSNESQGAFLEALSNAYDSIGEALRLIESESRADERRELWSVYEAIDQIISEFADEEVA